MKSSNASSNIVPCLLVTWSTLDSRPGESIFFVHFRQALTNASSKPTTTALLHILLNYHSHSRPTIRQYIIIYAVDKVLLNTQIMTSLVTISVTSLHGTNLDHKTAILCRIQTWWMMSNSFLRKCSTGASSKTCYIKGGNPNFARVMLSTKTKFLIQQPVRCRIRYEARDVTVRSPVRANAKPRDADGWIRRNSGKMINIRKTKNLEDKSCSIATSSTIKNSKRWTS